jgi:DNA-binding transcriptional regulator YiaG
VLHHLRSRRRTKRRVEALAVATEAHAPRAPSAHERTEARAELRAVLAAAETLPPDVRAVWIMREIEGLSSAEVASALDTREGTVRSRLFAARRAIVAELGRMGVEMPASPPAEGEAAGPGGRAAARGSAGAQVASGTGREDGREPQPAPARPRPAVAESSSDRAHIPADRVRVV